MSATASSVQLLSIEPAAPQCPLCTETANWARVLFRPVFEPKLGSPVKSLGIPNAHGIGYPRDGAVVVVEGATLATFVAGTITMLIIGFLLKIAGLGIICWALFALATHALPFFVGMTVGIYSFQAGAGPFGAIVVGFMIAGFVLVVGQYAFSVARSPVLRVVIGLLFALPAARAGYDATLALAHGGMSPGWWREVFAIFGAVTVGCTAWARMSIPTEPAPGGSVARDPAQPPIGGVPKGR